MTDLAIRADGLTKRYGDEAAVDDLDLAVPAGSVYGFLGPNGAGKTTTMRLLTSLTDPTAGTAEVAGVPVTDRAALTPRIGYLPADPPVFDELTGWEQLRHVARLHGLDDGEADTRIESLLERFDLLADADRRIESYSTGMTKKIGVVAAMLHDPDVLFLDEPTSGLDPRAARTVRDTVADLAAGDATVLLSTHVLPVVDELADTIGVIDDGVLVADGDPENLKSTAREGSATDLETVFMEVTADADAPLPDS
ncbi:MULTISPECIES: ABC transporter ATP-binding protein [Halobacterium]|uniref:ABC transporter ATP-binding protein n=1 Tax=Halobacterium TaxID=2239 RepID=UPI001965BC60|nr:MULTISPECIES: ABC transporter ATP-binding protein [Halobacterium]MCF2164067.1 ABC transporter ATP-binding protein [Halobacterium salinarum]MCF2167857.1 ABC transporter ATP-binding protein [Halobacterium salinarum]MCF2239320.1 ABC transporter ATP-binding protein [Halobacterium salinarum]MDL0122497.1 ABC transporter ATP-binding protein [Halobacterium salinarum]MDL0127495.1 ABC transporter ATP-binding protein [Halobacterium salinarum]